MKQKIIETGKCRILLVELPEESRRVDHIATDKSGSHLRWTGEGYSFDNDEAPHGEVHIDTNPRNKWSVLSRADQVTAEQADMIAARHFMDGIRSYPIYQDYRMSEGSMAWLDDPLKSLDTLFEVNVEYWENPFEKPITPRPGISGEAFHDRYNIAITEYMEAQSKVWDKSRTYILIEQK